MSRRTADNRRGREPETLLYCDGRRHLRLSSHSRMTILFGKSWSPAMSAIATRLPESCRSASHPFAVMAAVAPLVAVGIKISGSWQRTSWAAHFGPLLPVPPFAAKRMRSFAKRCSIHDRPNGFNSRAWSGRRNFENSLRLWIQAAHLSHVALKSGVGNDHVIPDRGPVRADVNWLHYP